MTSSQHTSTSIILTKLLSIANPLTAFAVGFISHWILDIQPYQEKKFDFTKINKQLKYLVLELVLTLTMIVYFRSNIVLISAVIGALLPDILDGIFAVIDRQRYNKGDHLFPFHRPNKNDKELNTRNTVLISVVLFILVLVLRI